MFTHFPGLSLWRLVGWSRTLEAPERLRMRRCFLSPKPNREGNKALIRISKPWVQAAWAGIPDPQDTQANYPPSVGLRFLLCKRGVRCGLLHSVWRRLRAEVPIHCALAASVAFLGLGNSSLCRQQHPWAKQSVSPVAQRLSTAGCVWERNGASPVGVEGLLHLGIWATQLPDWCGGDGAYLGACEDY